MPEPGVTSSAQRVRARQYTTPAGLPRWEIVTVTARPSSFACGSGLGFPTAKSARTEVRPVGDTSRTGLVEDRGYRSMAFDADSANSTALVRIQVKSARLAADKSSPLPRSFQPRCAEVSHSIPRDFSEPANCFGRLWSSSHMSCSESRNLRHTVCGETRIVLGDFLCRHSYG